MDHTQWLKTWDEKPDSAPWAMKGVNPYIKKYIGDITLGKDHAKVFFPMCGDVADMFWLAEKGHEVIGLEIAKIAVEKFFKDHNLEYDIVPCDQIKGDLYQCKTKSIKIYCGDMFLFDPSLEKDFDGVWDRGSFNTLDTCGTNELTISKFKSDYVDILKTITKPQSCILLELVIFDTTVDINDIKKYFNEDYFKVTDLGLAECYAPEYEKMGLKGFHFLKMIRND